MKRHVDIAHLACGTCNYGTIPFWLEKREMESCTSEQTVASQHSVDFYYTRNFSEEVKIKFTGTSWFTIRNCTKSYKLCALRKRPRTQNRFMKALLLDTIVEHFRCNGFARVRVQLKNHTAVISHLFLNDWKKTRVHLGYNTRPANFRCHCCSENEIGQVFADAH